MLSRSNEGFDFAGWGAGLAAGRQQHKVSYTFYIFLNGSVKGPYQLRWVETLLRPLSGAVKLVGLTLNCPDGVGNDILHVQSMVWATDVEGLQVLEAGNLFTAKTKRMAWTQEARLATLMYEAGYQMTSLQSAHLQLDPPTHVQGCDHHYPHDIWTTSPTNALPTVSIFPFVKSKYLPYINFLLVSHTLEEEGAQMDLLLLGMRLQALGALVEVAAPSDGPLRAAFERHHMPIHILQRDDQDGFSRGSTEQVVLC